MIPERLEPFVVAARGRFGNGIRFFHDPPGRFMLYTPWFFISMGRRYEIDDGRSQ